MNERVQIFLIVLCLFIVILTVSCGQKGAKWQGTIEEEDGIPVVRNPKEPIYSEDVFQLEEDLAIPSPEEEELMFQSLMFLVIDNNENIYVSDSKAGHILVFDKSGEFVRKIGRRGQGPGEMVYPFETLILREKEIFVNDIGQAKAHFFTLEGEFIRQMTTSKMPAFRRPKVDSAGNIVVSYAITGEPVEIFLKKMDSEFNPLCDIASCIATTQPPVLEYFEVSRSTSFVWNVTSADEIIWGDFKKYEIHVCNPEGKCLRKIVKDADSVSITQTEKNKLIKNLFGDNPVPSDITLKFPDSYPPFIRFTCDEEGRIFVQRYDSSLDEELINYDVFDVEGKYIAKITLNFRPQIWKNNMMYCVEEDEDGFEVIKRYRVNWTI
jgi:hypothetical protein